jgi:hypothetical protein
MSSSLFGPFPSPSGAPAPVRQHGFHVQPSVATADLGFTEPAMFIPSKASTETADLANSLASLVPDSSPSVDPFGFARGDEFNTRLYGDAIPEVYPTQQGRPAADPATTTSPSSRAGQHHYHSSSSSAQAPSSIGKSPAAIIIPSKRAADGSGGDGRPASYGPDRNLYPSYLGLDRRSLSAIPRQFAQTSQVMSSDPTATPGLQVELSNEDRRQPALVPHSVPSALPRDLSDAISPYPLTQ